MAKRYDKQHNDHECRHGKQDRRDRSQEAIQNLAWVACGVHGQRNADQRQKHGQKRDLKGNRSALQNDLENGLLTEQGLSEITLQ